MRWVFQKSLVKNAKTQDHPFVLAFFFHRTSTPLEVPQVATSHHRPHAPHPSNNARQFGAIGHREQPPPCITRPCPPQTPPKSTRCTTVALGPRTLPPWFEMHLDTGPCAWRSCVRRPWSHTAAVCRMCASVERTVSMPGIVKVGSCHRSQQPQPPHLFVHRRTGRPLNVQTEHEVRVHLTVEPLRSRHDFFFLLAPLLRPLLLCAPFLCASLT